MTLPASPATPPYVLRPEKLRALRSCTDGSSTFAKQPVVLAICGSFNPVHSAHFKLYAAAKDALETEGHYGVLGGFFSPVSDAYGKPGLKTAAQRVRVMEEAVRHHPELSVDTWECLQPTYTRTFFVLEQLEQHVNAWYAQVDPLAMAAVRQTHPRGVRVVLVCGADLFSSFWRPGSWTLSLLRRLLDTFPLVVVYRDHDSAVKNGDDFARMCRTAPTLSETVDRDTTTVNMRDYHFIFAKFTSPDDTSSTEVRDIATEMAATPADDVERRKKLERRLLKMVPASAVSAIVQIYGRDA